MIPKVPTPMEKNAGVVDFLKRVARGNKNLSLAQKTEIAKHVTPSGWAHIDPDRGLLKSVLLGGHKSPLGVVKSRYQQGGLFGKGGIVRGDLAFNPETLEGLRRLRAGDIDKGWAGVKQVGKTLAGTAWDAANPAFVLGMPAMAAHTALTTDGLTAKDKSRMAGGELGALLGYAAGGPLGILGSMAAGTIGSVGGTMAAGALTPGTSSGEPDLRFGSYRMPVPRAHITDQQYYHPEHAYAGYNPDSVGLYSDNYGAQNYSDIPFEGGYDLQNLQDTDLNAYTDLQQGGNESILPVVPNGTDGYLPLPEIPGS